MRLGPDWLQLTERVLAIRGAPNTAEQRAMAAVLDVSPGGVGSHATAAATWGSPAFRLDPIQVTLQRYDVYRKSPLAVVHYERHIESCDVKIVNGIPITSPGRTLFDLAASLRHHPTRLARLTDWFVTNGLLDGDTLDRVVATLAKRGRAGSTIMREIAASRGPGYLAPGSGNEARTQEILDRAGLGPFDRQVNVGTDEEWCGRVDFRHRSLPLILEVQSWKHHASLTDRTADALRRAKQEAAGFVVVEVWDHEVWHDVPSVEAVVREGLRRAAATARRAGT